MAPFADAQLRAICESDAADKVKRVGAGGGDNAPVVAEAGADMPDVPPGLVAPTSYVYVVDGESPVSEKVVPAVLPTEVNPLPVSRITLYVYARDAAFQETLICDDDALDAVRPVGTGGVCGVCTLNG